MLIKRFNQGLKAVINPATKTRAWLRLITKRLLRLAVAAALLLVIYNVWNIASLKSQQQLERHTYQLAQLMLSQVEFQTIRLLQQQDQESLEAAVTFLQQQPQITAVTIRSPLGEELASQGELDSVIDWPAETPITPWFMTRELTSDGETLGYLQVTFNQQQLLSGSNSAHAGLMQQGRVLLLLAMLAGVFIMLGFNRIRDRFWQRNINALQRK